MSMDMMGQQFSGTEKRMAPNKHNNEMKMGK